MLTAATCGMAAQCGGGCTPTATRLTSPQMGWLGSLAAAQSAPDSDPPQHARQPQVAGGVPSSSTVWHPGSLRRCACCSGFCSATPRLPRRRRPGCRAATWSEDGGARTAARVKVARSAAVQAAKAKAAGRRRQAGRRGRSRAAAVALCLGRRACGGAHRGAALLAARGGGAGGAGGGAGGATRRPSRDIIVAAAFAFAAAVVSGGGGGGGGAAHLSAGLEAFSRAERRAWWDKPRSPRRSPDGRLARCRRAAHRGAPPPSGQLDAAQLEAWLPALRAWDASRAPTPPGCTRSASMVGRVPPPRPAALYACERVRQRPVALLQAPPLPAAAAAGAAAWRCCSSCARARRRTTSALRRRRRVERAAAAAAASRRGMLSRNAFIDSELASGQYADSFADLETSSSANGAAVLILLRSST